jgi:hypothetical protein
MPLVWVADVAEHHDSVDAGAVLGGIASLRVGVGICVVLLVHGPVR